MGQGINTGVSRGEEMRIYDELKAWRFQMAYYDDAASSEKCPTPKGVRRYIKKLEEEIHKLKITAERLKKGLKE